MSVSKQAEFFDKVDVSVSIAKLVFSFLQENYPCKTIAKIAETTSGGTPLRGHSDYYGGNIPWIKSGELNDGLITSYEETITEQGLKNSSAKIYPKGTLVLALYGATAGKTGVVDFDTASNQAVAAIYPNKEIERDYLFWFFRQKRFDYLQMSFGAAQPNISQTFVKATFVPIPPKAIQKEVVSFLNSCERTKQLAKQKSLEPIWSKIISFYNVYVNRQILIKEIDQQQSYLQLLRQILLQEAVQGKLTKQDANDEPAAELLKRIKAEKQKLTKEGKLKKEKELPPISEDEIPFELPKGWSWCRLGEITLNVDYGTSEKATQIGEIPILRMGNVQEGKIVLTNLKYVRKNIPDLPKLFLKKKDLIFNRTNSYELVGKCGIFEGKDDEFTLASYLIRVSIPHDFLFVDYVNHYINSKICRSTQIEPQITQQTGQANFSGSKLKEILFPLPPFSEQQTIVTKVQQLQHRLNDLETQVQQSRHYAQQLLQAVLKEAFEVDNEYAINEQLTMAAEE